MRGFASGKPVHKRTRHAVSLHTIDMINDVEGERVTIWKTILSLFLVFGANGFEGAELLSGLINGQKRVCGGLWI